MRNLFNIPKVGKATEMQCGDVAVSIYPGRIPILGRVESYKPGYVDDKNNPLGRYFGQHARNFPDTRLIGPGSITEFSERNGMPGDEVSLDVPNKNDARLGVLVLRGVLDKISSAGGDTSGGDTFRLEPGQLMVASCLDEGEGVLRGTAGCDLVGESATTRLLLFGFIPQQPLNR